MKISDSFLVRFVYLPAAFIVYFCTPVLSQTDLSLRIKSLGQALAGLIEDELTDIYLNPARAALIKRTIVHAANSPGRTCYIPFPTNDYYYSYRSLILAPSEKRLEAFTYKPLQASLMTPLRRHIKASFAVQGYAGGTDHARSTSSESFISSYGGYIRSRMSQNANASNTEHFLFDAVLSSRRGSMSLGLRARIEHNENRNLSQRSEETISTSLVAPFEIKDDYDYESRSFDFQKTVFTVSAGSYLSNSFISDCVIGFQGTKYVFPSQILGLSYTDDDADGNGISFSGGPWTFEKAGFTYDSNRDYLELGAFARMHMRFNDDLRMVNVIDWSRGEGDGRALLDSYFQKQDALTLNRSASHVEYDYSGRISSLGASSALGYWREIHKDVFFGCALRVSYYKRELNEAGDGEVNFEDYGDNYPDSMSLTMDYHKDFWNGEETYYLYLPFAFEWRIRDLIALRLGGMFKAVHHDKESDYSQRIPLQEGFGQYNFPASFLNADIDYDSSYVLSNGVEINIKNRLKLDLFMQAYGELRFSDYDRFELRYYF